MIRILLSSLLGKKKWTQLKLAKVTGIRPNTINEYYHEFCSRIPVDHIDLICEALDCQVGDLIEYVPGPEPRIKRNSMGEPVGPIQDD